MAALVFNSDAQFASRDVDKVVRAGRDFSAGLWPCTALRICVDVKWLDHGKAVGFVYEEHDNT